MELQVLYEDDEVLLVDKPSGLLVHRGWGQAEVTLADLVRRYTRSDSAHPLGRLDRSASGAVLFAQRATGVAALQQRAEQGQIEKRYLVLVRGAPPERGSIDHPLARRPDGPRMPAVTDFHRLFTAQGEPRDVSLVLARPRTGRLHQVRRHLKHLGHPLIGDANYGKGDLNRAMRERHGLARLALHALLVLFRRADGSVVRAVESPLPDDLRLPFQRLGIPEESWGSGPLLGLL